MAASIMVVEDDISLRDWVEFELAVEGYQVRQAGDGLTALEMLRTNVPPDLILLDVQMPGMDGYEVCSQLQFSPALASVPVIFLTARTELDDKLTGFAAGGSDYLTKPFRMVELKARIRSLLRQSQLNRSRGRQEEQDRASAELEEAAIIQRSLMSCNKGEIENIEAVAVCRPARAVGGDLYDIHPRPDGRLSIIEADVSGKGMPAAMVTAAVRTVMREITHSIASPAVAVTLANRRMYDDLSDVDKLVTMFVAYYSSENRTLTYANAGHSLVVYVPKGAQPETLDATGVPIGIFDDATFDEVTVRLAAGDVVVICSDGFAEAQNEADELFGYERLIDAIAQGAHLAAEDLRQQVISALDQFVGNCEQSDDQTIIVLRGRE